jgi:predicted nucleic acid-binding protein
MCLILDTNRFSDALKTPPDPRYLPLLNWLLSEEGMLVVGGTKYRAEIGAHSGAIRFFAARQRAGQAHLTSDKIVDEEEAALTAAGSFRSDDPHIIALARKSGARTVCTEDTDLMSDVKDSRLLKGPKGRVYRNASHSHLLHHDGVCPRPPRR